MSLPVVTESGKVLAERVDGNALNKAFVFGEHPQLMTYIITIITGSTSSLLNTHYTFLTDW